MSGYLATALALLPDLCLIVLGAALGRWLPWPEHFWSGVERLVYYVLFPALLFNAIARTPFDIQAGLDVVLICGTSMAIGMVLAGLAWPVVQWLNPRHAVVEPAFNAHKNWASTFQCGFRFNSYVGLALAGRVAGSDGIALMGIVVGCMVPFANIASVTALAMSQTQRPSILGELVRNPLIFATLSGLLWKFMGLHVPDVICLTLDRLGAAAIAVGLICVGAGLKIQAVANQRFLALWMNTVKLLAMPATAWVLARNLGLNHVSTQIVVLFAALPTASSGFILAARMGGNAPLVASMISLSTLCALVFLPLWLGGL